MTSSGPAINQEQFMPHLECSAYFLRLLFEPIENINTQAIVSASRFTRTQLGDAGEISVLLDRFPGVEGASCCFVRLQQNEEQSFTFIA